MGIYLAKIGNIGIIPTSTPVGVKLKLLIAGLFPLAHYIGGRVRCYGPQQRRIRLEGRTQTGPEGHEYEAAGRDHHGDRREL